jgi:hypothetical protein
MYASKAWACWGIQNSHVGEAVSAIACLQGFLLVEVPKLHIAFQVNKSIVDMFVQIVLLSNPLWKSADWHLHVLIPIKGGGQVIFLYPNTYIWHQGC